MRGSRRALVGVVVCAALTVGCQRDEPVTEPATVAPSVTPSADATPSPEPTPAPSPTPDPFAVPTAIDAPYAERVLNALYEIDAETTRLALEAGAVTPEVRTRIDAVDAPEEAEIQSVAFNAELAVGLPNVRRPPGAIVISVERVLSASPQCVAIVGVLDDSALVVEPGPARRILVGLVADSSGVPLNPTSWKRSQTRVVDEQGEIDLCA